MADARQTTNAAEVRCFVCGCLLPDPTQPLPEDNEWACEECAADLTRDEPTIASDAERELRGIVARLALMVADMSVGSSRQSAAYELAARAERLMGSP